MNDDRRPDDRSMLLLAHDRFTSMLTSLTDGDHEMPTACEPWTVADVVGHVAGGAVMAAALVGGATANEALRICDLWTNEPVTADRVVVALAGEAVAFDAFEPSRAVDHHVLPMTAGDLLGLRVIEYAVHSCDIRQAVGDRSPLEAALAERAWQFAAPLAPFAAGLGVFGAGPSGLVPEDADDEARLLDVTGRRVQFHSTEHSETVPR